MLMRVNVLARNLLSEGVKGVHYHGYTPESVAATFGADLSRGAQPEGEQSQSLPPSRSLKKIFEKANTPHLNVLLRTCVCFRVPG